MLLGATDVRDWGHVTAALVERLDKSNPPSDCVSTLSIPDQKIFTRISWSRDAY